MSFFELILILSIGLLLILAEIILIPGTTLIGIAGVVVTIFGIFLSYKTLGTQQGHIVLGVSVGVTVLAVYLTFKFKLWNFFSLKESLEGRPQTQEQRGIKSGDIGVARSAIRPYGKGEFGNDEYEVKSDGNFIEAGSSITVTRVSGNLITVEKSKT